MKNLFMFAVSVLWFPNLVYSFGGFLENKGQWDASVHYRADMPVGYFLGRENGWVYLLEERQSHHTVDSPFMNPFQETEEIKYPQAVHVLFHNTNKVNIKGHKTDGVPHNFFLGNDPKKWGRDAKQYGEIWYCGIYENTDFQVIHTERGLKYNIWAYAGAKVEDISLEIQGANAVYLSEGSLVVETNFGKIYEKIPKTYQVSECGDTTFFKAEYVLEKERIRFRIEGDYDREKTLVIDPEIVFSTYTGSTEDNWGNTACFDDEGNSYAGGTIMGASTGRFVPSPGAFQSNFYPSIINRRITDVVITKFDSSGKNLLFFTYLGGEYSESPTSMIADKNGDLFILGITGSERFPTTHLAYDITFNGGDSTDVLGVIYPRGTDIFVAHLRRDGTELFSSTFFGGADNDGILSKISDKLRNPLDQNYGDILRGEIYIGPDDNIYIAGVTSSRDFSTSKNAFQSRYGGGQTDGVAVKLKKDLSDILWSSYIGGDGEDAARSIRVDTLGEVYIGGSTNSNDILIRTYRNAFVNGYNGKIDGFIALKNDTSSSIKKIVFLGTPEDDQLYLIDLDDQGYVHALGQTRGAYLVSPGKYFNRNGRQFIHKFNKDLGTEWSTVFGNIDGNSNLPNISPTAFLVSVCNNIYISGWGGGNNSITYRNLDFTINYLGSYFNGNTFNMPISANAYQSVTDGKDFYMMVLSINADEFLYGTYFGSIERVNPFNPGLGSDHVDGGTSRFDKNGIVYHAVCAGCLGVNSFPTTPGAFSNVNNSGNCNLGLFKFNILVLQGSFDITAEGNTYLDKDTVCDIHTFSFENTYTYGERFIWDFGDGVIKENDRNTFITTHTYPTLKIQKTYTTTLTIYNKNACIGTLVVQKQLTIMPRPLFSITQSDVLCYGQSKMLTATGGRLYRWTPETGLSNPNIHNPVATPQRTTTYTVTITNGEKRCDTTATVTLLVIPTEKELQPFNITNLEGMNAQQGCIASTFIFKNNNTETRYSRWELGDGTTIENKDSISHQYTQPGTYTARLDQRTKCSPLTTFTKKITIAEPSASESKTICEGDSLTLSATGGSTYEWSSSDGSISSTASQIHIRPKKTTTYIAIIRNDFTICTLEKRITITVIPTITAEINIIPKYTCYGVKEFNFQAITQEGNTVQWDFGDKTTGIGKEVTHIFPEEGNYSISIALSQEGCSLAKNHSVKVEKLFIPNVITPNGDNKNDRFEITYSQPISLLIIDKDGSTLYKSSQYDNTWGAGNVPAGTYFYHITIADKTSCKGWIQVLK